MGYRTRSIIAFCLAIAAIIVISGAALAQEPTPAPSPYNFEPYDYPREPGNLLPDFGQIWVINIMISTALTVFSLLDDYNVLGIFTVILLALGVLWWLYHFVTEQPRSDAIQLSATLDSLGDITDEAALNKAARLTRKASSFERAMRRGNPFR